MFTMCSDTSGFLRISNSLSSAPLFKMAVCEADFKNPDWQICFRWKWTQTCWVLLGKFSGGCLPSAKRSPSSGPSPPNVFFGQSEANHETELHVRSFKIAHPWKAETETTERNFRETGDWDSLPLNLPIRFHLLITQVHKLQNIVIFLRTPEIWQECYVLITIESPTVTHTDAGSTQRTRSMKELRVIQLKKSPLDIWILVQLKYFNAIVVSLRCQKRVIFESQ